MLVLQNFLCSIDILLHAITNGPWTRSPALVDGSGGHPNLFLSHLWCVTISMGTETGTPFHTFSMVSHQMGSGQDCDSRVHLMFGCHNYGEGPHVKSGMLTFDIISLVIYSLIFPCCLFAKLWVNYTVLLNQLNFYITQSHTSIYDFFRARKAVTD